MKFSKTLIALCLCTGLFGSNANASLVDLGYTLDQEANVVTDSSRNLQWLQWDVSNGLSISEGLAIYAQDGWQLANNLQMSDLMNDAGFGGVTYGPNAGGAFDADENTSQTVILNYTQTENSAANEFIFMFGDTFATAGFSCCGGSDILQFTRAIFGDDANNNGRFNSATVLDDYKSATGKARDGYASISSDLYSYNSHHNTYGLALVRSTEVSPVPVPASLPLLAIALLGFGFIRKRICKN